ncbi:hypothetical protein AYO44_15810 [Planctomycetaceae bacterium SCGC AG-212-F19]|nr:hypothetical protein AYO44_15810 [Planctomycetaceae bacterium SCGC AG-212-F19]
MGIALALVPIIIHAPTWSRPATNGAGVSAFQPRSRIDNWGLHVSKDTRIIKLPSRAITPVLDNTPGPDLYKKLAADAVRVDVELASIINAWSHLPRNIKDTMLTLASIRY